MCTGTEDSLAKTQSTQREMTVKLFLAFLASWREGLFPLCL
ncbi:hypothetical protein BH24GEM3_BH24GEM3_14250 [soil metagenome]